VTSRNHGIRQSGGQARSATGSLSFQLAHRSPGRPGWLFNHCADLAFGLRI